MGELGLQILGFAKELWNRVVGLTAPEWILLIVGVVLILYVARQIVGTRILGSPWATLMLVLSEIIWFVAFFWGVGVMPRAIGQALDVGLGNAHVAVLTLQAKDFQSEPLFQGLYIGTPQPGGGGGNYNPTPTRPAVAVTDDPGGGRVLRQDALFQWMQTLVKLPASSLTVSTSDIPSGVICRISAVEALDTKCGQWNKERRTACEDERGLAEAWMWECWDTSGKLDPIDFSANGNFSRGFGVSYETQLLEVEGSGDWGRWPSVWVTPTPPPAATPTPIPTDEGASAGAASNTQITFAAPVQGYCGWMLKEGEWELLICTNGELDSRLISYLPSEVGIDTSGFPTHP